MILYSILVSLWLLSSIIWFFFYSYLHLGPLHGQGVVFLSYLCYAVMRPRGSSKRFDLGPVKMSTLGALLMNYVQSAISTTE